MNKILLSMICLGSLGFAAKAQEAETPVEPVKFKTTDGFYYQVNDDQSTVTLMPLADGFQTETVSVPASATDPATSITYTVTAIGEEAFYGSYYTTKVVIPATVTHIAANAFFGTYVANIEVDAANTVYTATDGVLYSKDMATLCCFPPKHTLDGYDLPETVTEIGSYAFCGIFSLSEFEIPARIKKIGYGAFMGTRLKSIVIPATVKTIEGAIFQNCKKLTSVEFPEGMDVMGDHMLYYDTALESVNLPSTLTKIEAYAFYGAFVYGKQYGMKCVDEISIPDNVAIIEDGAFQGNRGLTTLTIGKSVSTIGLYAFAQCTGLKTITSLNIVPPACARFESTDDGVSDVFYDVPEACILYVPGTSLDAYKTAWGTKFKDIRPIESGVTNVEADGDIEIFIAGNILSINSASAIEVYNASGVKVAYSGSGTLSTNLPCGLYIVRSGNKTQKVTL